MDILIFDICTKRILIGDQFAYSNGISIHTALYDFVSLVHMPDACVSVKMKI